MATKRLYLGNLPYTASENDILNHFGDFQPSNARIIEGRGFGFVDVEEEHMEAAISAKNGQDMGGRQLVVNEARPREDRGPSGGGGGGGRYGGGGGGGGNRYGGGGGGGGGKGGRGGGGRW